MILREFEVILKRCQCSYQGLYLRDQSHRSWAQSLKIWPWGVSRPRPGLEDYITAVDRD